MRFVLLLNFLKISTEIYCQLKLTNISDELFKKPTHIKHLPGEGGGSVGGKAGINK